ncbi:MAG: kynurenine 3-monooxygenase [Flavobacteriales bacterium]|nr:kynurenine 3-monooxygenase [Flavobacteriales bacterium]
MEKVAVIGAGLVGSLQAIFLAKKGFEVEVYERRPDIRQAKLAAGRSINLALSNRGWKALEQAGIKEEIEKVAIPMYGRAIHDTAGNITSQAYGQEGEAIYSVSRGGLNKELIIAADKYPNVKFFFEMKCEDVDLENSSLTFTDKDGKTVEANVDRIFATDGAFSAVRARMQKTDRFNYSQYYLAHGYKELSIPPTEDGGFRIEKNALHIWPRGSYMLIALPNSDGSFTCTLFFPFEGKNSFSSITDKEKLNDFFKSVFPDAYELMPHLEEEYFENPTSSLVTVRCSPWNYEDKVIMMGDASHAIVPFYGQGMNSGFEDCTVFDEVFEAHNGDWKKVMPAFAEQRKPDADAIADLAIYNFIEMRDKVADEDFLLRKKIEKRMFEEHPDKWMPLYSQVTFSHIPYSKAWQAGQKQDQIMDKIMQRADIANNWDSVDVRKEILALLKS